MSVDGNTLKEKLTRVSNRKKMERRRAGSSDNSCVLLRSSLKSLHRNLFSPLLRSHSKIKVSYMLLFIGCHLKTFWPCHTAFQRVQLNTRSKKDDKWFVQPDVHYCVLCTPLCICTHYHKSRWSEGGSSQRSPPLRTATDRSCLFVPKPLIRIKTFPHPRELLNSVWLTKGLMSHESVRRQRG